MSEENTQWKPDVFVIRKGRPSGFRFSIELKNGTSCLIKFENNRYEAETAEHAELIKALLHKPQFTQNIMLVDVAAGVAIAKAHQQAQANSAIKGGVTTETMKQLQNAGASPELKALSENAEIVKQMADEGNLVLTHDVNLSKENAETPTPAAVKGLSLSMPKK